ncbi:MAG: HNH endonuclease signature motif containing protein [Polyangiaceae bacterium]
MTSLHVVGDGELLARTLALVGREREVLAELVEHLAEIDRRRLYLDQACSSLFSYCHERLGFSEDEAIKRMRVARLVARRPEVVAELRSGNIHLTGLFLLSRFMEAPNWSELLSEARGKSRRELERLLAGHFPRPDVPGQVLELAGSGAGLASGGPGASAERARARLEPLSESRYRVEFTASSDLHEKMVRAEELLSHSVERGDLAQLFERALDCLIEQEARRRLGAGRPHARRALKAGSRHVPVEVARQVWERDGNQCTFIDADGRRCSARHLLTLEHRVPFALGGPSTVENLCILCASHNAHRARRVYGEELINDRRAARAVERGSARDADARSVVERVHAALLGLGFVRARWREHWKSSMTRQFAPSPKDFCERCSRA